ncbi:MULTISPECIES: DUF3014 domain-containing protein [Gammaproteobacteria]|uniref:DUF3014 domain-containing protein n=1 Tax=Gammaproteobacteria TaxID=1236 RepID=UPI001402B7E0|nr:MULTISPECIES: DUF3014 domain-containing protein [Gammaproteobacteria]
MREENSTEQTGQNQKTTIIVAVIAVIVIVIIGWTVFSGGEPEPDPEPVEQEVSMEVEPEEEEVVTDPVEEVEEESPPITDRVVTEPEPDPLPGLNESTPAVMSALDERSVDTDPVTSENLIRDLVVFIDNIAAGIVARDAAVIDGPSERFMVQESGDTTYIDPRSYARYDAIVDWFVGLDEDAMVAVFEQFEPLFDEAYAEVSRPGADFRDRVRRAVSVLNAAPEQNGRLALNDDEVMYTFADESLESLPAAQRQMIRLGPDNMRRVKAKLTRLLNALNN